MVHSALEETEEMVAMMSGRECCLKHLEEARSFEHTKILGISFTNYPIQETIAHCSTQLEMAYEDYLNGHDTEWADWAGFKVKCQVP